MSHAGRISTVGSGAPSTRKPALATVALVIPSVVVIAVAIVLAATGPGADTQSKVAPDAPGGSQAAGKFSPASLPDLRTAPRRGSVPDRGDRARLGEVVRVHATD